MGLRQSAKFVIVWLLIVELKQLSDTMWFDLLGGFREDMAVFLQEEGEIGQLHQIGLKTVVIVLGLLLAYIFYDNYIFLFKFEAFQSFNMICPKTNPHRFKFILDNHPNDRFNVLRSMRRVSCLFLNIIHNSNYIHILIFRTAFMIPMEVLSTE